MSFKEYVKKYGKYPFTLLDKEGDEIKLFLSEQRHQEFMDYMELATDVIQQTFRLKFLHGIEVEIEWEKMNGELKILQDLSEQLEGLLNAQHLH